MRSPRSLDSLEELGRVRLSQSFFFRDFLYSEVANFHGMPNIPEDPDLAIEADGLKGATACVVIPWFADRYAEGRTGEPPSERWADAYAEFPPFRQACDDGSRA